MELGFKGKVAFISGGSAGIGRATARALAAEGARVVIAARTADRLAEAGRALREETGGEVLAEVMDATDPPSVDRAVAAALAAFGRLDILVNSTGAAKFGDFEALTKEEWEASLASKLLGQINCARAVFPHMRRQRWGRIINLVGSHGRLAPADGLPSSVANAGLFNFTLGLAKLGAKDNVLVNAVNPGPVATDRIEYVIRARAAIRGIPESEARQGLLDSIPLGRFARAEEVADLITFLASERAGMITGALIPIDGGQTSFL